MSADLLITALVVDEDSELDYGAAERAISALDATDVLEADCLAEDPDEPEGLERIRAARGSAGAARGDRELPRDRRDERARRDPLPHRGDELGRQPNRNLERDRPPSLSARRTHRGRLRKRVLSEFRGGRPPAPARLRTPARGERPGQVPGTNAERSK